MVSEKIKAAMDLTALMTVEQLAEEMKKPQEEIMISFMESNTAKMLYDNSTKLWWDGPLAVAGEYKEETAINFSKSQTVAE